MPLITFQQQSLGALASILLVHVAVLPCWGDDDLSPLDMLPGIAQPIQQAELACTTEGVLRELHVQEGDWIDVGQLVASLDDSIARSSFALAEKEANHHATVQLAKVRLNEAELFYQRIQRMYSQRAASEAEVDRARYDVLKVQAEYDRAVEAHQLAIARVEFERARLEAHKIRAPFAGRVISIQKQVGEFVSNNDVVVILADPSQLRVDLFVPWNAQSSVDVGQSYTLISDTFPDRRIKATCVNIEPKIDPASQTFRCRFVINNEAQRLPAGLAIRLCLPQSLP